MDAGDVTSDVRDVRKRQGVREWTGGERGTGRRMGDWKK